MINSQFNRRRTAFIRLSRIEGIISHTDVVALNEYFIDDQGNWRDAPPSDDEMVEIMRKWHYSHTRAIRRSEKRERAATKAGKQTFEGAIEKLDVRFELMDRDKKRGVKSGNSLATLPVDWSIIQMLQRAGIRTQLSARLTTDSQLDAIFGIGDARIAKLRKHCPYLRGKRAQLKMAKERPGQLAMAL